MMKKDTLYTIGYEGKDTNDFARLLVANNVDVVVDVREIPWSRKKGFSKTKLTNELGDIDIHYLSFPELGSPSPIRKQLYKDNNYKVFFEMFGEYLDELVESLIDILTISKEKKVCLMCFEHDPETCHRCIIANKLQELNPNLQVEHL